MYGRIVIECASVTGWRMCIVGQLDVGRALCLEVNRSGIIVSSDGCITKGGFDLEQKQCTCSGERKKCLHGHLS